MTEPATSPESAPESVEVTFHGMAHGGEAVGRLDDGVAIFVAGALPGETARVLVTQRKKRWARGELVEVLKPSEHRVQPPCPHFGPCGGCQWQHIELGQQRELKREVLISQLQHLGGIENPPVDPVRAVGPDDGFGYRNHAMLAVTPEGKTAYRKARSHELVPIDACPLLHPLLQEWHAAMPPLLGAHGLELRAGTRTGQRLAMVQGQLSEDSFNQATERGVPLKRAGHDELSEMVGAEKFRVSSKAFFQVNTEGAEALTEMVMSFLDPQAKDTVVDLYCGVGLFTVPLARKAAKVFAVEGNNAAVRDLRFHAKGLPIHIVGTSVERAAEQMPTRLDLVVADPPREGLGAQAEWIASLKARKVALVSCDPAAMARDAKALIANGYTLKRVLPIDLFPHTFHVEAVGEFELSPTS